MTRLIDADALKRRAITVRFFGKDIMMVSTAEIDSAPTIDAVKVVRCKDCKHHEKFLFDDSKVLCWVHDTDIVVSPTDYCSYGERREDGEDCRLTACAYPDVVYRGSTIVKTRIFKKSEDEE